MLTKIIQKEQTKGIVPVHSFDLWGTLVKQEIMGKRVLQSYLELKLNDHGMEPEAITNHMEDYKKVIQSHPDALKRKKEIVDTVEEPLWKAYENGEVKVDFHGAFYQDSLESLLSIAENGERFCIITTGNSPWVRKALENINPVLATGMLGIYSGNKSKPETYESAYQDVANQNGVIISHTEDQLKGFEGLLASKLKDKLEKIYIERKNLATAKEVLKSGIDWYLRSLREFNYTKIKEMRE